MATQSNGSKAKTPKPKAKKTTPATAASPADRARTAAETAVDLPVGAVLEVTDRVTDLVEPFTDRSAAERQLKSYRSSLSRTVKRTERRGSSARRRATSEARKTRTRFEREARKRRGSVEDTLKRNRSRAQDLVDQVGEQLAALR